VAAYQVQHLAKTPHGWHVRSRREGSHLIRIAFPPGRRRRGAGKVVEVLHPKKNPACPKKCGVSNPAELLVFGNPAPARKKNNHKPGCKCIFCKRQKQIAGADAKMPKAMRGVLSRNPSDEAQAVRLFKSFSGRDPSGVLEMQMSAAMRLDYVALGDLDYLIFKTPKGEMAKFSFDGDGVKLGSSPDGKQLYCIGGNQKLNLNDILEATSLQKDFIDLGSCMEVQYLARKVHISPDPTDYYHKFGEETGDRPRLMYSRLQRQVFFVGGAYRVTSRGIEN
jgi:hypothetical protein